MTEKGWQPDKSFVKAVDDGAQAIKAEAGEVPAGVTREPSRGPDIKGQLKSLPQDLASVGRELRTELASFSSAELEERIAGQINQAYAAWQSQHPRLAVKLDAFISGATVFPKDLPGWLKREAKKELKELKEAHVRFKEATPDWVYQGKWGQAAMNYWKFGRTVAPLFGGPAALLAMGAWTAEAGIKLGSTVFSDHRTFSENKREFLLGLSGGTAAMIVSQFAATGIGLVAGRLVPGGEGAVRLISYGARRLAVPYINQIVLAQIMGQIGDWDIGKRIRKEYKDQDELYQEKAASAAKSWFNAGMVAATIGTIGAGFFVSPVLVNLAHQIREAGLPSPVEGPTETPAPIHTPTHEPPTPTQVPLHEPAVTPTHEPTPTVEPWHSGEMPNHAQIAQAEDLGTGDIDFDGTPDGHWLDIDHDGMADVLIDLGGRPVAWVQEFDLDGDGVLDRVIAVDFNDDGKADSLYAPEDLGLEPEAHHVVGHASPIMHERNQPPVPRAIDLNEDGQFDTHDLVREGDIWYTDLDGDGVRDQLTEANFSFNDNLGRWEIEGVKDLEGRVYTFDLARGWAQTEEAASPREGRLTEEERLNSRYGRLILGPKGGVWGLVQEELYNRHPDWNGNQIANEAYKAMQVIGPKITGELPTYQGAPVVYSGEDLGTFLDRAGIEGFNLDQFLGS